MLLAEAFCGILAFMLANQELTKGIQLKIAIQDS